MRIWVRKESACVRMVCDSWSVGWTLFAHKPIATKVAIRESRGKMPIDRLLIANRFDRWSIIADSSLFDHFDLCAPLKKKHHAEFQSGWSFWILITIFNSNSVVISHAVAIAIFFTFDINFLKKNFLLLFSEIYCFKFFFHWFFKWNKKTKLLNPVTIFLVFFFSTVFHRISNCSNYGPPKVVYQSIVKTNNPLLHWLNANQSELESLKRVNRMLEFIYWVPF